MNKITFVEILLSRNMNNFNCIIVDGDSDESDCRLSAAARKLSVLILISITIKLL